MLWLKTSPGRTLEFKEIFRCTIKGSRISMSLIITTFISVIDSAAVKYIRYKEFKTVSDPYINLPLTDKDCKAICDLHSLCNAYSVDTFNSSCFLSSCNTFRDVPTCSTCSFARKEIPSSVVLCSQTFTMSQFTTMTKSTTTSLSVRTTDPTTLPDTTNMTQYTTKSLTVRTTDPTTMPDKTTMTQSTTFKDSTSLTQSSIATLSLITKTTNDTTATNDTSCVCVCKYVNLTLDESIERRRKELIMNKTRLSSTIRKLTSAPDYRKSVEVIGTLAIVVLVVLGLFLFCSDVCSIMSFVWFKKCVHMNH